MVHDHRRDREQEGKGGVNFLVGEGGGSAKVRGHPTVEGRNSEPEYSKLKLSLLKRENTKL